MTVSTSFDSFVSSGEHMMVEGQEHQKTDIPSQLYISTDILKWALESAAQERDQQAIMFGVSSSARQMDDQTLVCTEATYSTRLYMRTCQQRSPLPCLQPAMQAQILTTADVLIFWPTAYWGPNTCMGILKETNITFDSLLPWKRQTLI